MSNPLLIGTPILMPTNAGYGETPPCPEAKFARGAVVNVRKRKHLAGLPRELVALVAVPPNFPGEYALADLLGEPRPLMIEEPSRAVSYICCREGDTTPYHIREVDLVATGDKVEIGTISREAA